MYYYYHWVRWHADTYILLLDQVPRRHIYIIIGLGATPAHMYIFIRLCAMPANIYIIIRPSVTSAHIYTIIGSGVTPTQYILLLNGMPCYTYILVLDRVLHQYTNSFVCEFHECCNGMITC